MAVVVCERGGETCFVGGETEMFCWDSDLNMYAGRSSLGNLSLDNIISLVYPFYVRRGTDIGEGSYLWKQMINH